MIRHDQELYYIGSQAVEEPQKWLKWYDTTDNDTGAGWLPYLLHIFSNTLTSMSSNILSHFSLIVFFGRYKGYTCCIASNPLDLDE